MDTADDTMITLTVKTPNLDVKDQHYECNKNWTVKSLKVFLSDAYPTKPNVENQRLIYFGHLLPDNALLREVLNVNDSKTHTIHLACPPSENSDDDDAVKNEETRPTEMRGSAQEETITVQSPHSIALGGMQGYYLRNGDSRNYFPTFPMTSFYPGHTSDVDFTQQAALMHQMYMQYMVQYFQYAQSMGMYRNEPNQPAPVADPPSAPSQTEPQAQTGTPPPVNHNRLVQDEAPENENRPVQNEAEAPAVNRDILDMIYILSRVTVLLSVIYFYSSLGRCLFVMGIGCLIYIYRGGIFCFRRERHRNEARHVAQPRRNPLRHEPAASRNRRAAHGQSTNINEARHRRNDQVTAVKAFVMSFFSSLIPDQNHPINVN